jgi:hypothetical protein
MGKNVVLWVHFHPASTVKVKDALARPSEATACKPIRVVCAFRLLWEFYTNPSDFLTPTLSWVESDLQFELITDR